jgi:hypothetical protein
VDAARSRRASDCRAASSPPPLVAASAATLAYSAARAAAIDMARSRSVAQLPGWASQMDAVPPASTTSSAI